MDASVTGPGFPDGGAGMAVHTWLTTTDLKNKLTRQADAMPSGTGSGTVTFDDTMALQTMDGFGTGFTDSSTYLIYKKLSASDRAQVMSDLFSPTTGIGQSFMRLPMGASDFVNCNGSDNGSCSYSYDDGVGAMMNLGATDGMPDPTLANFSISHDEAYIVPVIKEALALNPQMHIYANPWSPPAWMKTNSTMLGTGGSGVMTQLSSDMFAPLALYFVKFIQAYQADGIPIWGVTPQNEPDLANGEYPCMIFNPTDEANFIATDLAPALKTAGIKVASSGEDATSQGLHIMGGDTVGILSCGSCGSTPGYEQALFGTPATDGVLWGTTSHCYSGSLSGLAGIHNDHPTYPVYMTECSTGPTGPAGVNNDAAQTVMSAVNSWASGVILWNIALDTNGGPKVPNNCNCTGLVTIDQSTGNYTYTINYYELGQFSKFVFPGAKAVMTNSGGGVTAQAFKNPDGSDVLVVNNGGNGSASFTVSWGGRGNFSYMLDGGATVTFSDEAEVGDN